MNRIPVAISQCLVGEPVRFDGGHKHNHYITEVLGQHLEFRPVCPEVAIGLGVPRKPVRLIVTDQGVRVRGLADSHMDVTAQLTAQADQIVHNSGDICGHIFMQNSPSCGVYGLKRYTPDGQLLDRKGRGAYAQAITENLPLLPVEEAGRLNDPVLCENFLTRVFAYHDWKIAVAIAPDAQQLTDFYARYHYLIMAHHPPSCDALRDQLSMPPEDIHQRCDNFLDILMNALNHIPSRANTTRVLKMIYEALKNHLDDAESETVKQLIDAYYQGREPLSVPLTQLSFHKLKVDNPYLIHQVFWEPTPDALGLRKMINAF